ncbi:MAG TPA: acetylglutamate kinase [Candidatus Latescibacteria bacterium]|nr:acetylglutamate kinase [Candidatus Latescibacterota bacterium]
MEEFIKKAGTLIEALPYIRSFKGKIVVIKCGGSLMSEAKGGSFDPDIPISQSPLIDIIFMQTVGMRPVVVHGGREAISKQMEKAGIKPRFTAGLRVTDEDTMKIVEETLLNRVNVEIVEAIERLGGRGEGISARGVMRVTKHLPWVKGANGERRQIDIGFVGDVESVDPVPIRDLCEAGVIPVIAPIGLGPDGHSYNVNADIVAGEIAIALQAEKLVFLTDVMGIMKDPEDPDSLISTLKIDSIEGMIGEGVILGGMIPKVKAALKAVQAGVHKTHIIDGRLPHSLLLEIFTDKGIGTQIVE